MANVPMPDGLTNQDLECVMIDLEPFDIRKAAADIWDEDHLFYGDVPELKYAQGPVGEAEAHVTLLFGIHPSVDYEERVYTVLDGWDLPPILIDSVGTFPSTIEGQDYVCVVAHVVPDQLLVIGNKRLQVLPHTNRFTEYRPHVTLAYLKGMAPVQAYVDRFESAFAHTIHHPLALNLGQDD